ncbi:hypothetical protein TNCV_2972261 [Trichonephila clavipes]|nr:hypothetical protein TNCV_2972261 [Trichonephila clavipes]
MCQNFNTFLQWNKNITNADALSSEREKNLTKENGETQQADIKDEYMQDFVDQQPSKKDIVLPEDIIPDQRVFRKCWI